MPPSGGDGGDDGRGTAAFPEHASGTFHYSISRGMPVGTPLAAIGGGRASRPYTLYVPHGYTGKPTVLWVLAPGNSMTMDGFLNVSKIGMIDIAEEHTIAMVVLLGVWTKLAVGPHARGKGGPYPDDVAYTKSVLRSVTEKINVDYNSIRCVGFSRGARFCTRLASELSNFIAAIAVASGIRFPVPNNSTRPVPVVAFHGTNDPVNPFFGGGEKYWGESVLNAVRKWSKFNGCRKWRRSNYSDAVVHSRHWDCSNQADVEFYVLRGGGHNWPLDTYLNANERIVDFFARHPGQQACGTAEKGSHCYDHIQWVMTHGIDMQPWLYHGLSKSSGFHTVQSTLHRWFYADCPKPCATTVAPSTITATTTLCNSLDAPCLMIGFLSSMPNRTRLNTSDMIAIRADRSEQIFSLALVSSLVLAGLITCLVLTPLRNPMACIKLCRLCMLRFAWKGQKHESGSYEPCHEPERTTVVEIPTYREDVGNGDY